MPHDGGPPPAEMAGDVDDVREQRVERIVLVLAPARLPKAAMIEDDDLAALRQSGRDPDPVVGIEIVAAMQDDERRLVCAAVRPEGAVEQRDIPRLNFPRPMQRLVHAMAFLYVVVHRGRRCRGTLALSGALSRIEW